jgi:hypothetical protein
MPQDNSARFDFRNFIRAHGVGVRGLDVPRRSEQYEGRFGRMFRGLPAAEHSEGDLQNLADAMTAAPDVPPAEETELDPEENRGIAAGYTYWGQFIDHDITFDPASSLQKTNDPDGLVDFRTPRFDLDSVYGRGPDDQPYLYEADGIHLLLGRPLSGNPADPGTRDLPRNAPEGGAKRALTGDPRNDENVIVSQLHGIFLRFHNAVADFLGSDATFAEVQRVVRWHYQWAVLHDFLPTICGDRVVFDVLPSLESDTSIYDDPPDLRFFHWHVAPFMPIEFSVGAYRFGHSMVRPEYRLNASIPRFPIFATNGLDLRAFGEFPSNWAIEWQLFFHLRSSAGNTGPGRVQPAYKIDSSLVDPLRVLPFITDGMPSLARRNLRRGLTMGLPSGQTIARHMCIEPISDDDLRVGKATEEDNDSNPRLVDISTAFAGNAPLWYYILAEAQQEFEDDDTPIRLGPVGGRIVAEVIAGLILGDNFSYLAQQPCWRPMPEFCRHEKFGMAELILVATGQLG